MEVGLHIPDEIFKQLSGEGGDISRHALEALSNREVGCAEPESSDFGGGSEF